MISSDSVPDDARRHKADRESDQAIVVRAVTIGRPRGEVFAFFRDFKNLERFMDNVQRIEVKDDIHSHWRVSAPLGHEVEWDSLITEETPGELLAWETLPGSDIMSHGRVVFKDAPGGRGTEVHATIIYEPLVWGLGRAIAGLLQKEPGVQAKQDLRRLKMLLETGEIATSQPQDAAPRYDKTHEIG